MTERELSQKLEELAGKIEEYLTNPNGLPPPTIWSHLFDVAKELKSLSNQKYSPGNSMDWSDLKNQAKPTKNRFPF